MSLKEIDFFEEALHSRRQRLRYRIVIALMVGTCFTALGDWIWPACWYALYISFNLFEDRLLAWREVRCPKNELARVLAPCFGIGLSNAIFLTLAAPAPDLYGAWGVTAFGFLTAGVALYSIMAARASRIAFIAAMVPISLGFLALPFMSYAKGGGIPSVVIVSLGAALTLSAAISQWRDSADVRRAEMVARRRAEAGEAAKTRFLAMVSHDLRTPLMAILAGAAKISAVSRGKDQAEVADGARLIEDAALMMRTILDDLLTMFKTEAGKMTIDPVPTDIHLLCQDFGRFWRSGVEAKALVLTIDIKDDTPAWVQIDATRLRQILNNLFSNAVKFTHVGGVTLTVQLSGDHLQFGVSDTGGGMTESELAGLFQPFSQTAEGAAEGGTGLGLMISRELARTMGGDLTVESEKGAGSTFTLILPCVTATCPESEAEPIANDHMAARCLRLLIVDDHPFNREALTLMVADQFQSVATAASGKEALSQIESTQFDVVLMDVNMPGMDGLETTRQIRKSRGANANVAIIAVTGSASDDDGKACLDAGMDGWVAKPIRAAELFNALDSVLNQPLYLGATEAQTQLTA